MSEEDPLLQQSVNFDKFMQEYCEGFIEISRSDTDQTTSSEDAGTSSMSKDELNVLQYVGGYVPHSLLKKYEKRSGTKYEQFITCLGNMAVLSEHDCFLEYTKEWVQRVNRGGLFPLNNTTYLFFISIEKQVRNILLGI